MKAILISIQPQHVLNILNGSKTLELRKSVPKGYVGWVYVYCTKGGETLCKTQDGVFLSGTSIKGRYIVMTCLNYILNGKVVARFWFDEYEELFFVDSEDDYKLTYDFGIYYDYDEQIFEKLCLTKSQVNEYGMGKDLYAWHIKKLEVLKQPIQLIDFISDKLVVNVCGSECKCYSETASYFARKDQRLTKAPQSWQYVWVKENV